MKITLAIMAAGIGSRFGGGIKQLEPVGPSGEIIIDYSIHDAIEAGFNKIVFIIRKDIYDDFMEVIGHRIESLCEQLHVEIAYAFQEKEDLPEGCSLPAERKKPWGTGQAVLACRDLIHEPFAVINADDYYGKEAYREAYSYLTSVQNTDKIQICMVSFVLKNTLSENGGVTRGICQVGEDGMLAGITETHNIKREGDHAVAEHDGYVKVLDLNSPVSMNMWGLTPVFFNILEEEFEKFLSETEEEDLKAEYLLPVLVGQLLQENKICVKVLRSEDAWFGVTYKEDRETVVSEVNKLIEKGMYPSVLYS